MKKLFIIANWKSNKTIQETEEWLHNFHEGIKSQQISSKNKEIIISPSFTVLEHANYCLRKLKLPVELAAQDISPFGEGAYTGEINAQQIKELADYIIVGHSERRKYFYEDEDVVNRKIEQALEHDLIPVLCVSNLDQIQNSIPDSIEDKIQSYSMLVAYEPLFAIGSGKPDTPENAEEMAKKIKEILRDAPVIYGGSVTSKNVKSFIQMPNIHGVLVGGASLNPLEFLEIVKNA